MDKTKKKNEAVWEVKAEIYFVYCIQSNDPFQRSVVPFALTVNNSAVDLSYFSEYLFWKVHTH